MFCTAFAIERHLVIGVVSLSQLATWLLREMAYECTSAFMYSVRSAFFEGYGGVYVLNGKKASY